MKEMRALQKPQAYGPPPSPEELAAQWDKTHYSLQEMLRFGEMLSDLEASDLIDNSPILKYDTPGGIPVIVARNPGLRGWLAENCPHIGYKTAMRYKSLAQKARRAPEKTAQFIRKSPNVCDLYDNRLRELKISRYELEHPRSPYSRPRAKPKDLSRLADGSGGRRRPGSGGGCRMTPLITSLRSKTHDAMKTMTPEQRSLLAAELRSLAEDVVPAASLPKSG
jgi:hypothetical protein